MFWGPQTNSKAGFRVSVDFVFRWISCFRGFRVSVDFVFWDDDDHDVDIEGQVREGV